MNSAVVTSFQSRTFGFDLQPSRSGAPAVPQGRAHCRRSTRENGRRLIGCRLVTGTREKIDIYLDEWFVGTLHLSRRTPPDCRHVNEHIQSTWFDVITAERPPGTYAVRAVGFDDFPGDPSTIEWAATERFERGCTAYLFQCGDDLDCLR